MAYHIFNLAIDHYMTVILKKNVDYMFWKNVCCTNIDVKTHCSLKNAKPCPDLDIALQLSKPVRLH